MAGAATDIGETVGRLKAILAGAADAPESVSFDPQRQDFAIAISRVRLDREYEVLDGLVLRPTYATVFAHAMLAANRPPNPRAPHPPPWQIVEGAAITEVIHAELFVSAAADIEPNERLVIARNIIALLRLIVGMPILAPAIANMPYTNLQAQNPRAVVSRFEPQFAWSIEDVHIGPSEIESLTLFLGNLAKLGATDRFAAAFVLADGMWWLPTLSAQMIAIWSAAETLMRPSRMDMTKELARSVRTYLGQSRSDGDRLYQEVVRLCASRGGAAHVGREPEAADVQASYYLLRGLLLRSLLEGEAPPELKRSPAEEIAMSNNPKRPGERTRP
jgi:hypothetical protein